MLTVYAYKSFCVQFSEQLADCLYVSDVVKVRRHLELLREEYVKLQNKHTELEKKYHILQASSGANSDQSSFVSKLLAVVADLFEKEKYR